MKGLFIVVLLLLAFPAGAAETNIDDIKFTDRMWSNRDVLKRQPTIIPPLEQFDNLFPPPPANSSPETRAELDALLKMQETERTPKNLRLIQLEVDLGAQRNLFYLITEGVLRYRLPYPLTNQLIEDVNLELNYFVARAKDRYKRARPTQIEPRIIATIPVPDHPAYPSGHAAQTWIAALFLSYIDPPRAEAYKANAAAVAHRREVAGVHYPSDAVVGRKLAEAAYAAFLKNPDFVKRLEECRAELSKTPPVPPPSR